MTKELILLIKDNTNLLEDQILTIINLIEDGHTIPFIARYRKEMTGNASDEELRLFEEVFNYSKKLLQKKEDIKNILYEKKFLDEKIKKLIENAKTLQSLEDIYSPFKTKKSSRTTNAITYGLEPLANIIHSLKYNKDEIHRKARKYINKYIHSTDDAILGAKDIIAQRYADDYRTKDIIRNLILNHGLLEVKEGKNYDKNGLYINYVKNNEKIKYIKSYKLMAILRAQNEKQLSIKINIDENHILDNIKKFKIPSWSNTSKDIVFDAYKDGLKRLLLPSLKREVLTILKEKASTEAINLFGNNLKELLKTAPLVEKIILGIDPGYKTGCKLAVIDNNGNYLDSSVIYPTKPKEDEINSRKKVIQLIKKYNINSIAIGNGTASRETANFISKLINENNLDDIKYAIVSEVGASVYSASKIACEEYPNLDVTTRGAISIAQRLRDPMAALVKIDPKALGIGQYQHDVNQKDLALKLENITTDLVNSVGVDLNSASYKLLSFISGISENLAKNIINHRKSIKKFSSKQELLNVKGLGDKAYEQSVGFLRIKDGQSILDNTSIHPEDYNLTKKIQKHFNIHEIKTEYIEKIAKNLNTTSTKLTYIISELKKPGYDVRLEFNQIKFANDITKIEDLKEGYILNGIVRNITDFGAFVDIGLKNDALLHISQISKNRISHPSEILSINQNLENIKIINIDVDKQRVNLSLK